MASDEVVKAIESLEAQIDRARELLLRDAEPDGERLEQLTENIARTASHLAAAVSIERLQKPVARARVVRI